MIKPLNSRPTLDLSLIVPNYNQEAYLEDFLDSVVESSHWPRELILVDDGSTDNSLRIISSFESLPFLVCIPSSPNKGLVHALNMGLEKATGKFIARADPDDILMPHRLVTQVRYLEDHPGIDVVGANVIYFITNPQQPINYSDFPQYHDKIIARYARGDNGIQHPTLCARAHVFHQLRYTEGAVRHEDYLLICEIINRGYRLANIPDVLYAMRIHPESATSTTDITPIRQTFSIRDHYFGKKTTQFEIYRWYFYIRLYRLGQLSQNRIQRFVCFALAGIMQPDKFWKRMISGLRRTK